MPIGTKQWRLQRHMGVTIFGYAEVLRSAAWDFVGEMAPNPAHIYDADLDDYPPEQPEFMPQPLFESYHKELAAILTGLDNPIRSSVPYTPVASPRGLPPDLSTEVARWLRRHKADPSFTHTWFTRRELDGFGWEDRIMRRRAMVDRRAASLFADCPCGFPLANWPADVPVSYAGFIRGGVEVEWLESYAEIVPEFYREVLPRLAVLGPPDDVRLVLCASW
ncbi:MAG TPA: hypothetical protein VF306_02165 [Pirellulales bacterium]